MRTVGLVETARRETARRWSWALAALLVVGCQARGRGRPLRQPQHLPEIPSGPAEQPRDFLPPAGVVLRYREEAQEKSEVRQRTVEVEVIAEAESEAVVVQRPVRAPAAPRGTPKTPGSRRPRAERPPGEGTTYFVVRWDAHVLRTVGDPDEARPLLPWPPEEGAALAPSPPPDADGGDGGPGREGQKEPRTSPGEPPGDGPWLRVVRGPHPCSTPDGPRQGCVEVEYRQAPGCSLRELYAPGLLHVRALGVCGEQRVRSTLVSVLRRQRPLPRPEEGPDPDDGPPVERARLTHVRPPAKS